MATSRPQNGCQVMTTHWRDPLEGLLSGMPLKTFHRNPSVDTASGFSGKQEQLPGPLILDHLSTTSIPKSHDQLSLKLHKHP